MILYGSRKVSMRKKSLSQMYRKLEVFQLRVVLEEIVKSYKVRSVKLEKKVFFSNILLQ